MILLHINLTEDVFSDEKVEIGTFLATEHRPDSMWGTDYIAILFFLD